MQIIMCDKCGKEIKGRANEYYVMSFARHYIDLNANEELNGNRCELCKECAMETFDFVKKGEKHNELDKT